MSKLSAMYNKQATDLFQLPILIIQLGSLIFSYLLSHILHKGKKVGRNDTKKEEGGRGERKEGERRKEVEGVTERRQEREKARERERERITRKPTKIYPLPLH